MDGGEMDVGDLCRDGRGGEGVQVRGPTRWEQHIDTPARRHGAFGQPARGSNTSIIASRTDLRSLT